MKYGTNSAGNRRLCWWKHMWLHSKIFCCCCSHGDRNVHCRHQVVKSAVVEDYSASERLVSSTVSRVSPVEFYFLMSLIEITSQAFDLPGGFYLFRILPHQRWRIVFPVSEIFFSHLQHTVKNHEVNLHKTEGFQIICMPSKTEAHKATTVWRDADVAL